jgi:hypothetical protein
MTARAKAPIACSLPVAALAMAAWGCNGGALIITGPSVPHPVNAYIIVSPVPSPFAVAHSVSVAVVISATAATELERVTIRLNDGSHVGGTTISVPKPGLNAQFGTTHFGAGTTKTFTTTASISRGRPYHVAADIDCVDAHGLSRRVTVERPWP